MKTLKQQIVEKFIGLIDGSEKPLSDNNRVTIRVRSIDQNHFEISFHISTSIDYAGIGTIRDEDFAGINEKISLIGYSKSDIIDAFYEIFKNANKVESSESHDQNIIDEKMSRYTIENSLLAQKL